MKPAPIKDVVTIDDLARLDIRIGTILTGKRSDGGG